WARRPTSPRSVRGTARPVRPLTCGRSAPQNPPTDAAEGAKWEQQIRQIRYTRLENDGISTEVGKYVHWSMVRATGDPARPPAGTLEEMTELAIGHCEDSGVELRVPKIVF
ncbi:hypothetical protein, partial [Actinoplanes philippinensis]|uniref:hypothetical protein n=1 Tax=Actinoplanes philippinensis TaxID=35752 RepID=UPI0033DD04BC